MINKKSKSVLIATGVYSPEIGGPASYARTLGTRLSDTVKVTVLTYSTVFRSQEDLARPYRVIRVWKKVPKGWRHLIYLLKAIVHVSGVDTVLALNAVSAGVPALLAAKINKKKFFVKIVGDAAWEYAITAGKTSLLINDFQKSKKKGHVARLDKYQKWTCRNACRVIVPSNYLAGIVQGWGIPRDKIEVIYNGVDFKPSTMTKEEARKSLGIFGHVIISWGRLVPWKGFRMLIKLMPQISEINQAFRLVVVGDGPDYKVLEAMIKNMGLSRKVFLVGKKNPSELAVYLAAADMFVLNTGYEGFSHQILEAMTAGVPVITTAAGGNVEVIEQGRNGFLVRYNDEFNLIEAVKSLWQSPEVRAEFIEQGKETAKKFNAEQMLSETVKVLLHS